MSKQSTGSTSEYDDNDSAKDRESFFAWEIVNDETQSTAPPPVVGVGAANEVVSVNPIYSKPVEPVSAVSGTANKQKVGTAPTAIPREVGTVAAAGELFTPARGNFIRDQLDKALDLWWGQGEFPPLPLLRDALLMLEAGGSATESQRTLLLRAALAYDRGVQTALRYQVDNERVAFVFAEALVEWEPPLEAGRLLAILGNDRQLRSLLKAELERGRILLIGEPRLRAELALDTLAQLTDPGGPSAVPTVVHESSASVRQRRWRQILFLMLVLATIGFVIWNQRQRVPSGMLAMPNAEYAMLGPEDVSSAFLEGFFIDRFEVTNREYRLCVNEGKCAWPVRPNSSTRSDYFTNPAFDDYPVVEVTKSMAESYCSWQRKRIPSADEWQAAASVSPATGQAFPYPWGESFDPQRANSVKSGFGDTVVVGSFRPAGDSPSGAVDMAGNAAEWSSTLITSTNSATLAVVKGGSFVSEPEALRVGAERMQDVTQASPDIGFRCALTAALTHS